MRSSTAPRAFISYRWEDPEHDQWVERLSEDLLARGIQPHLDRWEVRLGDSIPDYVVKRIGDADAFLFVMTPRSVAAVEAPGEGTLKFEIELATAQKLAGGKIRVIGIFREGDRVAPHLQGSLYADFRDASQYAARLGELADDLLGRPRSPRGRATMPPGTVARAAAFDLASPRLPNQVFAIELLTEPVWLSRLDDGRVCVSIDRDGVSRAVVTSRGRREICDHYLGTPEARAEARRLDREIHRFLLRGGGARPLRVPVARRPLRWASGGVMSVVRWRGEEWTPFFFRDIKPYGWNLSLGASEREDDLSDPWTFQVREFFEETLILEAPPRPGTPVACRRIALYRADATRERARADAFTDGHRRLRRRKDNLIVRRPPRDADEIEARVVTTGMEVVITHRGEPRRHPDVLVCLNLLELGIEVVKVVRFDLRDGDSLLDGEAYHLDAGRELVRMPAALISHAYLRKAFGVDAPSPRTLGRVQPSVRALEIDDPAHVHVFPFDAERRREIAEGRARGTAWERKRYGRWMRRFGPDFLGAGPIPLFTPAAAKILSYYFADEARRRPGHGVGAG